MKSAAVPLTCSMSLIAMMAAGLSQWWSVNQLVSAVNGTRPKSLQVAPTRLEEPTKLAETPNLTPPRPVPRQEPQAAEAASRNTADRPPSQKFFEEMLVELKTLRQQNQDLKDQLASTNREMVEVQFRLDSMSDSFRPLKVTADPDPVPDDGPGVLPPRAIPANEEMLDQ